MSNVNKLLSNLFGNRQQERAMRFPNGHPEKLMDLLTGLWDMLRKRGPTDPILDKNKPENSFLPGHPPGTLAY